MSMHRVVVSTIDGVVVAEDDIAFSDLTSTLALLILQVPHAAIYIDGYALSDPDRAALAQSALLELGGATTRAAAATPAGGATTHAAGAPSPDAANPSEAPPPSSETSTSPPGESPEVHVRDLLEPPRIQNYQDLVLSTLSQAHTAQVLSLTNFHEVARKFSDMWIERERQFADEAARQRAITRQSLADIDLLGRSLKLAQMTELNHAVGNVGASFGAPRGRTTNITVMDAASGLVRLLGMMKQLGG